MQSIIFAFFWSSVSLPSQQAGQQTLPKNERTAEETCPDTRGWTGKYTNHSYGFAITIPSHLQGFWNSARCVSGPDGCTCMSDHGRIIPLTAEPYEPERHLEVFAGYVDEPTLGAEVAKHLAAIRQRDRGNRVDIRGRSRMVLAGIAAERLVVRYYDPQVKRWSIEDCVDALRDGKEYTLYLRTSEQSYGQDRIIFDSIVKSFRFTRE